MFPAVCQHIKGMQSHFLPSFARFMLLCLADIFQHRLLSYLSKMDRKLSMLTNEQRKDSPQQLVSANR